MRAGGGYDVDVLRSGLGAVVRGGLGRAVDPEPEAVVGPGVLLVVELDRALFDGRKMQCSLRDEVVMY